MGMAQMDSRTRCHSVGLFQEMQPVEHRSPWALRTALQWFNCLPWLSWNIQQLPAAGCIPSSNEAQIATAGKRLWPGREGTGLSLAWCYTALKPITRPCLCSYYNSKVSIMEYQDAGVCRQCWRDQENTSVLTNSHCLAESTSWSKRVLLTDHL